MFSGVLFENLKKVKRWQRDPEKSVKQIFKGDIDYSSNESIREALKEIIVFVIFLLSITIVANASQHVYMFYFNQTLERSFLTRNIETDLGTEFTFNELVTTADWWLFIEKIFVSTLHGLGHDWENEEHKTDEDNENLDVKETNGQNEDRQRREIAKGKRIKRKKSQNVKNDKEKSDDLSGMFLRDNLLLGPPRLRQIRVKEGMCEVHDVFLTYFIDCYAAYKSHRENKTKLYQDSKFYTMSELQVRALHGQITKYYGAGYVINLSYDLKENLKILKDLKNNKWVDRGTRLLILEFVLFNINTNIFNNVKLLAELPPVGGIVPSHRFQAIKLHNIWNEGDWLLYIAGVIFYALVIFYTIEKIVYYISIGSTQYFFNFWNSLDILVLILSYLSLVYSVVHYLHMSKIIKKAEDRHQEYVSIDHICYWNHLYVEMIAVCVFLVWIKIFKYISFNMTMYQFSTTLKRCAKDLFGFAVMFFIVFLAYAQLGLLIFGNSHPDFREFDISVISLMRMFLGDFEYQLIEDANPVLGPIFFLTYVMFVFFILLNMFLAIINDTYGAVKKESLATYSNLGQYFKRLILKPFAWLASKMKLKKKQKNSLFLSDIDRMSSPSLYPATTDEDTVHSPTSSRVQKRASEIFNEYFEELSGLQQEPAAHKENENFQSLNKRLILLENVFEQLIINMDRILKKVESKRFKTKT